MFWRACTHTKKEFSFQLSSGVVDNGFNLVHIGHVPCCVSAQEHERCVVTCNAAANDVCNDAVRDAWFVNAASQATHPITPRQYTSNSSGRGNVGTVSPRGSLHANTTRNNTVPVVTGTSLVVSHWMRHAMRPWTRQWALRHSAQTQRQMRAWTGKQTLSGQRNTKGVELYTVQWATHPVSYSPLCKSRPYSRRIPNFTLIFWCQDPDKNGHLIPRKKTHPNFLFSFSDFQV